MASIKIEDVKKMKVAELKTELKNRGLATSGTKDVLLERLQAELEGKADSSAADSALEESIDELVGNTKPVAAVPGAKSKENIPSSGDASGGGEKKVVKVTSLSEEERLKSRAAKFGGAVSDTAKKAIRAERFGLPISGPTLAMGAAKTSSTPAVTQDLDKMKKRAERFGTVVSNKLSKVDEEEKKKKRIERFGQSAASASEPKKVKLNSSNADMDEKKKKRAERFGLT